MAGVSPAKTAKWQKQLSSSFLVNSTAISNDGQRLVACTYYYPYPGTGSNNTHGTFGTYCYDSSGTKIWEDQYTGNEGVFAVAISGDGKIAAAGGLLSGGKFGTPPDKGIIRAFNAANGQKLVDYQNIPRRVNSVSLSGDGGVLAGVAGNSLYVFVQKNGKFPATPDTPAITGGNFMDSVAVHPSGQWLAACDRAGNVALVTVQNGAVARTYQWKAPVEIPFLSVAAAQTSDSFVVGGGNVIYLFTKASMTQAHSAPVAQFTPGGAAPSGNKQVVRWVAISGNGAFITDVENVGTTGLIRALTLSGGNLIPTPGWRTNPVTLSHNPNSTSIDASGRYVTECDGEPFGTPGSFNLFDAAGGNSIWNFATNNMNWPMFISADGSAIAAGSDNGNLYYFDVP